MAGFGHLWADVDIMSIFRTPYISLSGIKYIYISHPKYLTMKSFTAILCLFVISSTANSLTYQFALEISRQSLQAELLDSEDNIGKMEGDFSLLPAAGIKTENYYFQDSNWGYFTEFMIGGYHIDKQEINNESIDLGTKVSGKYGLVTPTFIYSFNKHKKHSNLIFGIGFGIGYLDVNGSMIMSEIDPTTRVALNDSDFGFSVGILLEYETNSWYIRLSNNAPIIETDTYELMLHNTSILIGHRFDY